MKNIKLFLLLVLTIFSFNACEDDVEKIVAETKTASVLLEADFDVIELDGININNPALTLSWSDTDFGVQTPISYRIEFSIDDLFTNPINAGILNSVNAITWSSRELNSLASEVGLPPFQWNSLYARVVSFLGTNNALETPSNVIVLQVFPFFNYPFTDYYLVGDGTVTGWDNNNNNPALFRDGSNPDIYYYTAFFTVGHFKLLEILGQWQPQWGTNDGSTIEVNLGGDNGVDPERFPTAGGDGITEAGFYSFVIDFSTNTYTFDAFDASGAADFTSMTAQGSSIAGDGTMTQSAFDSHIWSMSSVHLTQGDIQFMTNTGSIWAGTTEFSGQATTGGGNIPVIVEDDYNLWFNDLTGHYIMIPINL